ncbi:major facilitator superfamily transporter monocarboxylate [Sporothrix brasiliensis 5110]|uniref:Major facilitator superfamily transporter monocarboxylate n=1 Tax=Sporothrix brasiliensis 5110 TaxID=1398154 RepID=A0A0C2F116_9PEZI|nr:major facilitator superfamily transporter monocarboxylate [Sporothrix brasiliensis 5110]KIH92544.1 major facilitator superfamily transporter monocarboxylate [Sporothrix brasiliensis 5110]
MASTDALPMANLGARRTRAGATLAAIDNDTGNHVAEEEDYHATPALPPVSRGQQASVLVAAFLAIALSIGYNQCYGVFQEYYLSANQNVLKVTTLASSTAAAPQQRSTALLAFVGTLGAGLTWAGSIFVNPWLSRVEYAALSQPAQQRSRGRGRIQSKVLRALTASPRSITLGGVALMGLGFLLASFATQVWHLLLTQGLLYGLGSSMLYFPLLGPAPEYFNRHRATAIGLILSGGGVGSLVLSPVVRALLSAVGGRWTLRFLAALSVVVGTPVAWVVPPSRFPVMTAGGGSGGSGGSGSPNADSEQRPATEPIRVARRRTHISTAMFATPAFLLSVAAAFCQSAGAQLPLTFIPSYSVALGLSAGTGATLLAVSNIVNAVARVATGYAGDRFGRLNVLAVSLAVAAVTVGALWGMSVKEASAVGATPELLASVSSSPSAQLWLAFIVLYSVAAGGYYALFPATIADVFGIRSYAAVNGFIYFVRGCGTMVGSPVGGVLLGTSKAGGSAASSSSYAGVVVWDGTLLVGSAACVFGVRWADALRRGWVWRA